MLIAPLTDPVSSIDDLPLFIDALAYVGIMNINIEHPIWPQTANHDVINKTPVYYLKKSCESFEKLKFDLKEAEQKKLQADETINEKEDSDEN